MSKCGLGFRVQTVKRQLPSYLGLTCRIGEDCGKFQYNLYKPDQYLGIPRADYGHPRA